MRKIIFIAVGLVLAGFAGRCVYMIACISCTFPPIKTYNYSGSMDQFESAFKAFAILDTDITYQIKQRDSSLVNSARDLTVLLKDKSDTITYNIVLSKPNKDAKVALIGAFDSARKTGGYSDDDPAVKQLFNQFKTDFLVRLEKDGHIILKSDPFDF
ncbi:MAG: hypothetical protein JWQ57_4438 [Mucilaginibacter sp.]|nr:hypothetical protein [Mucilaginibacter sp.]